MKKPMNKPVLPPDFDAPRYFWLDGDFINLKGKRVLESLLNKWCIDMRWPLNDEENLRYGYYRKDRVMGYEWVAVPKEKLPREVQIAMLLKGIA